MSASARQLARACDYASALWYIRAVRGADEPDGEPVCDFNREEELIATTDLGLKT